MYVDSALNTKYQTCIDHESDRRARQHAFFLSMQIGWCGWDIQEFWRRSEYWREDVSKLILFTQFGKVIIRRSIHFKKEVNKYWWTPSFNIGATKLRNMCLYDFCPNWITITHARDQTPRDQTPQRQRKLSQKPQRPRQRPHSPRENPLQLLIFCGGHPRPCWFDWNGCVQPCCLQLMTLRKDIKLQ